MKISHVRISNYRCLKSVDLDLNDYTVLIGTNGTGKSSVLYALNWFFNGGELTEADLHVETSHDESELKLEERSLSLSSARIEVEVTFDEVSDADRAMLGKYARGDVVRLRRSWPVGGKQKMVGNSMQGPGFSELRAAPKVAEMRTLYRKLRETLPELPDVTVKDDLLQALADWEAKPENRNRLVALEDDDATHLFGFAGEEILAKRFRLILVRAAVDIAAAVGTAGKGSILSQLIGALTTKAVSAAKREREEKYQRHLDELETTIRERVADATKAHADLVTRHFSDLVTSGAVTFVGEAPEWSLRGEGTVRADVTVNGMQTDVGRHGHGVQRALMMAVLQAMVNVGSVTSDGVQEIPDLGDEPRHTPPSLLLCLEEPEIYQHPVRARHFARVLTRLATAPASQVLLATHSPYFVLPSQFESLRRFSVVDRSTQIVSTSVEAIASVCDRQEDRVRKCMEKEVPRTFSEGFFADSVVLVEGDTDRVAVETVAERLDTPLDAHGIAVLAMHSKDNLRIPAAILGGIGVPVYVVADGDALAGSRKHPDDPAKAAEVSASHRSSTTRLLAWLTPDVQVRIGALPTAFGAPTIVTTRWTLFHDDLEEELSAWPEFLNELADAGGDLRDKNVAAYRTAAHAAPLHGLPENLRMLIAAIGEFGETSVPPGGC